MKYILSPYTDIGFNKYILKYTKNSLRKKCEIFKKDDIEMRYKLDGLDKEYTIDNVIDSLKLDDRMIYFSNEKLINYIVYDLGQRLWYDILNSINNAIHSLYIKYKGAVANIKKTSYNKPLNSLFGDKR